MRNITFVLLIIICFTSCKSSKRDSSSSKSKTTKTTTNSSIKVNSKTNNIIDYALQFEGVKYKYGGTTKKGMDCSGLVMTSFKSEAIKPS